MRAALARLPLLVVLAGILATAMFVPAIHALVRDAHAEARAFFYWGAMLLAVIAAIGLAVARHRSRNAARSHLVALLAAYAALPAVAAIPLAEAMGDTRAINAWLEMVAAATTTGGSLFDPDRLSSSLHLWRALVAWLGGLLIWIAAAAILAPLRLGGFEVVQRDERDAVADLGGRRLATPEQRVARAAIALVPVYTALTLTLWIALAAFGEAPTRAAIHAMSVLATSGITPDGGAIGGGAGLAGELVIFAFLLFAVSRHSFASDLHRGRALRLVEDRELRLAAAIVSLATLLLFARHWVGAFEVAASTDLRAGLAALWGTAFTVLSFLTTTGFVSAEWDAARAWSGLDAPDVLLLGLAMFGGGVATTAGGVKLLRIFTLYAHGRREMNLLVHPHSVAGGRGAARRVSARGIEAAWVFFMLFATAIALVTLALAATGLSFEPAMVLAVAALSTTGPLMDAAAAGQAEGAGLGLVALSDTAKVVLAAAMVVGRLETLALVALFNPDFWRS
jgi:trk system potassium uptake protein TrkH